MKTLIKNRLPGTWTRMCRTTSPPTLLFLVTIILYFYLNPIVYCEGVSGLPSILTFTDIFSIKEHLAFKDLANNFLIHLMNSFHQGFVTITTIVYYVLYTLICSVYYSLVWSPVRLSLVACCAIDGDKNFPSAKEYSDLHLTETLKDMRVDLKGKSGIYCFMNTVTGAKYVGSSMNLYNRAYQHIIGASSNDHLQNAIKLYGLESFDIHSAYFVFF